MSFTRPVLENIINRINAPRKFIQVLSGARQTGKTTLTQQLLPQIKIPTHYATADEPSVPSHSWIDQQWEKARLLLNKNTKGSLLILDEIQKISGWSQRVKYLWDEDTRLGHNIKLLVLGSAPLLVQKGLTESLAGRFETISITHWSFSELQEAFDFSVEEAVYFGAYPGAAELIKDENRWRRYIRDALIETTISRDILLLSRVDKPALLRRLFQLGCEYSSQILSYQKMLGQLQDAGNTTTLAHYLELLYGAGMLTGIQKFAGETVRQRGSSPKFQVLNTALLSAQLNTNFKEAQQNKELWGHLVESAVGAYLVNAQATEDFELTYFRESQCEVDFVLTQKKKIVAIEVKSGRVKSALPGLELFGNKYPRARKLVVGAKDIPLEKFLTTPIAHWFE